MERAREIIKAEWRGTLTHNGWGITVNERRLGVDKQSRPHHLSLRRSALIPPVIDEQIRWKCDNYFFPSRFSLSLSRNNNIAGAIIGGKKWKERCGCGSTQSWTPRTHSHLYIALLNAKKDSANKLARRRAFINSLPGSRTRLRMSNLNWER